MFTPGRAATELEISPQTLRRWSQAFSSVLSPDACPEAGHKRRYSSNDLAILARAKGLFDTGHSVKEVAAILPTVAGELAGQEAPAIPTAPEAQPTDTALTVPTSVGERFLAVVSDQKTAIERLTAHDDAQAAQLAVLAAQVATLTAQLAALQRAPAPERPPTWLERLMGTRKR